MSPSQSKMHNIIHKLELLWELNPDMSLTQVIELVQYAVEVEVGRVDFAKITNEEFEDGLDFQLEGSKTRG